MMRRDGLVWRAACLALLSWCLPSCGGGGGGAPPAPGPTEPPRITGRLLFEGGTGQPAGPILEAEPNDAPDTAHSLGSIEPGDHIVVHGRAAAGSDDFDGFHLFAPERVRVTATLQFSQAGGADLDFGVFDLITFNFTEIFLATTTPEVGVFHAKGSFDLVVNAAVGAADYVLTIDVTAAGAPINEREPNAGPVTSMFLGEMRPGDAVLLAGSAHETADDSDGFSFVVPEACRLGASLSFPGGADYDIEIRDITTTFTSPPLIASFDSPANNPETGSVDVPASRLLWIQVIPFAGSGAWQLTLTCTTPPPPLQDALQAAEAGDLAPLAAEGGRWKHGRTELVYGRPQLAFVPGDVLVGLHALPAGSAAKVQLAAGAEDVAFGVDRHACVRFGVPAAADAAEAARWTLSRVAAVRGRPGVRFAEPNLLRHAHAEPNDTHYNLQWHYEQINLPAAWDVTTGSNDVIVAVLDTGAGPHPDFTGRLVPGYDFISIPSVAADGDGRDPDPTDPGDSEDPTRGSSFHGTHVAGTIGAATNNGRGVAGVTWQTRIMHVRVLGRGGGSTLDIAEAIRYAAGLPNGAGVLPAEAADIINMSLGGGGFSQTMADAIAAARAAGVTIFASAGNEGTSVPNFPASYDGVISVAAVDLNGNRAPYSSFGTTVDVAAPGGDVSVDRNGDGYGDGVLSPMLFDDVSPTEVGYAFYQGTSMACPHAAGVAALMLAVEPTLTPADVETLLTASARDLGAVGRDDIFGHGLIDAHAAVLAAQGGAAAGPPQLALGAQALDFGSAITQLDTTVSNAGGGLLEVTGTSVATQAGGPWLAATPFGRGNATRDVDGVRVSVNRTGLAPGVYVGSVTVSSTGGTGILSVLMTVSDGTPATTFPLYVLAIDPDTQDTIAEAVVPAGSSLDYALAGLPDGSYLIVAGSDLDDDGFICDSGEICGFYPVQADPIVVTLGSGEVKNGLDFAVAGQQALPAGADGGPRGYRRLR